MPYARKEHFGEIYLGVGDNAQPALDSSSQYHTRTHCVERNVLRQILAELGTTRLSNHHPSSH